MTPPDRSSPDLRFVPVFFGIPPRFFFNQPAKCLPQDVLSMLSHSCWYIQNQRTSVCIVVSIKTSALLPFALHPGLPPRQPVGFFLLSLVWARAVLLTTPTVTTVGCSLTIPIAFASDFALHGKVPNALAVSGALLVVGGFYFVSGREGGGSGGASGGGGSGCRSFRRRVCCLRRRRALSEGCCSPSPCAAPPFVRCVKKSARARRFRA